MSRPAIDQTSIQRGFTLTPKSPSEAAAMPDNSIFMDSSGAIVCKKAGTIFTIVENTGAVHGLSGIAILDGRTNPAGDPVSTVPINKIVLTGSAVASISENAGQNKITLELVDTGGGGGGGSPSGSAGGDLAGTYPNPSLKNISGLSAGDYVVPSLTIDAKGRVTTISSLATITSAQTDDGLFFNGTEFVNKKSPYKKSLYESARVQQGFASAVYNTLADGASGFSLSGAPSTYDQVAGTIAVQNGSVITTVNQPCSQVFKILVDTNSSASYTIDYSIDGGSSWVLNYTKGSIVTLGSSTSTFKIRINATGSGTIYGFGVLSSPTNPIGLSSAKSISVDNTGFGSGNAASVTDLQGLASVVNNLPTPSPNYVDAFTSGATHTLTTTRNKTYFVNNKFTSTNTGSNLTLNIVSPASAGASTGDTVEVYVFNDINCTNNAAVNVKAPNSSSPDNQVLSPTGAVISNPSSYAPSGYGSSTARDITFIKLVLVPANGVPRWQVVQAKIN